MSSDMIANRYLIAKEIGHGGMADVYLAVDSVLNREVAVKVLRGELSADPVALLRFQREANSASAFIHPNVVEIYDVGEYEDRQYIVMEYVRGKTLKQLIATRGALSVQESVTIMRQLTSAVSEAHKHGIIHRDIKPQNVLIKDDGTIKITDFGIALAQDAIQLTQTDSVMGSVHYLAPEVARGDTATDQSDIYSLGIVFYELLSGDVPFHGESPIQIAMKHMEEEIPSIRDFDYSIPQSIENIIIKATAKNRAYRYLNAEELLKDLSVCLDAEHADDPKLDLSEQKFGGTITIDKVGDKIDKDKNRKKTEREENWFIAHLPMMIGLALVAIVTALTIIVFSGGHEEEAAPIYMIDITGKTVEEATAELEELGLSVGKVRYTTTDDTPKGQIISFSPTKDTAVEKGTAVSLVVSDGIYFVVGNYTGMQESEVRSLLSTQTNVRIVVENEYNSVYSPGTIIRQETLLEGEKLDPSRKYEIKLVVASYLEILLPTDIVGSNVYDAMKRLEDMGANVRLNPMDTSNMSEEELAQIERDIVIRMTPEGGNYYTQEENAYVVLYYY